MTELLAPAGSFESLKAAVCAGADAVYVGGAQFGARAYADNFDQENLKRAIDYIHIHGKKIYLTLNTLLKEDEISEQIGSFLLPLYREGLDAVIVQDLGVLSFVRAYFPSLAVHASTQMCVTSSYGVEALRKMGVCRVILPRELSLEEICQIRRHTDAQLEIFVHGALCYSYSGQCLMSSVIGGRSGNRGRCAGPCRLPYTTADTGKRSGRSPERYLLNMKDLCTIDHMPSYLTAGVDSLKIEGRMKSPEYVAGTVEIYRRYLDRYFNSSTDWHVETEDRRKLRDLYSRGDFTDGYLFRQNGRAMIAVNGPKERIRETEYLSELREKYLETEKKEKLYGIVRIIKQKESSFELKYRRKISGEALSVENAAIQQMAEGVETSVCGDTEVFRVSVTGPVPEQAKTAPLTDETVRSQYSKMGNTEFELENLEIILDDGVYLDRKSMNEMRRECVDKLRKAILQSSVRNATRNTEESVISPPQILSPSNTKNNKDECRGTDGKERWSALVSRMEQWEPVINCDRITDVYLEGFLLEMDRLPEFVREADEHGKKLYYAMPHIFRDKAIRWLEADDGRRLNILRQQENLGYLVRSLDECEYLQRYAPKKMVLDYSCWRMNDMAQEAWERAGGSNLLRTCVSPELNEKELLHSKVTGCEFIFYGKIPVMITANCLKNTTSGCRPSALPETIPLTDRTKTAFSALPVCRYCYNLIYNSVPQSFDFEKDRLGRFGFGALRYQFTTETAEETKSILEGFIPQERTRGHFHRGVE